MQRYDSNHQHPADLCIRGVDHGPQVPHEEEDAPGKANGNEDIVQGADRTPADYSHRKPYDVCISVQCPAFDKSCTLSAKPFQASPQPNRDKGCISVYQASCPRQQAEVVFKVYVMILRKILADCACDEEDEDDRCCDPERAIEIWVAIKNIEEGSSRVERRVAAP